MPHLLLRSALLRRDLSSDADLCLSHGQSLCPSHGRGQKRECGRYRRADATGNSHCHVRLSQGRHHDASQSSNPPLRVRMMTAWLSHYDIRVNESVPPSDRPDRRPTGLEPAGARRSGSRTGSSRAQTPALRGLRPVVLLAGVLMTVGALYLGREFLIPVAVAGLLTFVLNPIVRVFERRLPRAAAVVLVVILTFAVLGAFTWALATQAASLGGEIPSYRDHLKAKAAQIRGASRGGVIEKVQSATKEVVEELQKEDKPVKPAEKPVPVVVKSAGRGLVAASRRPGGARQRGPGARAGDLHAPGAAPAARSSDPADRLRADRHDHEGHGRGRPADHPLLDHADPHQWQLRPRRGRWAPCSSGSPTRSSGALWPRFSASSRTWGPGPPPSSSVSWVWRCSTDGSSRS